MARSAFLLVLPTLFLGACHVSRTSGDSDENVSITVSGNGQLSFNLPFAKGEVRMPRGTFEKGQFDIDGVRMIPGGTIQGFNMNAGEKGATVRFAFSAPKSPDEVRSYFVEQFQGKGDEVVQSGDSVSGKTKEGDSFLITIGPSAQGSAGTAVIHSKDKEVS